MDRDMPKHKDSFSPTKPSIRCEKMDWVSAPERPNKQTPERKKEKRKPKNKIKKKRLTEMKWHAEKTRSSCN